MSFRGAPVKGLETGERRTLQRMDGKRRTLQRPSKCDNLSPFAAAVGCYTVRE